MAKQNHTRVRLAPANDAHYLKPAAPRIAYQIRPAPPTPAPAPDLPLDQHKDHFLTVTLLREFHPRKPWIRLAGLWLKNAGFCNRTRVRVQVSPGCLIITTLPPGSK